MNNYDIPASLDNEINTLEGLILKFRKGEISATELKAHRVPFGVYEQRQADTYMMRIRCAAGIVTPQQLEMIADLASRYGTNNIHITTRQELQIHNVILEDLPSLIRSLKEIGLATRGGGGNTVRNITAQEDAGIDSDEVFDVTPYVVALTSALIKEADSWTLPRKFKLAFSGSSHDKGYATISDVGFIAKAHDGKRGFRVYVAGGLGIKPQPANLLFDFIEEDELLNVAGAVKSIFWHFGNRKNKHAARLRFLWNSLGQDEFKKKFNEAYEEQKKKGLLKLIIGRIEDKAADINMPKEAPSDLKDFDLWISRFVRPQKQENLFSVLIPVELGFISNECAASLARFLKDFGENVIRMNKEQNFLVRNIPEGYLGNVYNFLKANQENFNKPSLYARMLSCAGASTCQLGICLSRGAARAIMDLLKESDLKLDKLIDIKINISGCPNSCGQHPAADLGFFGKAARIGANIYPAYNVVAGSRIFDGQTKLAQTVGEIAAKDLPKLVKESLSLYLSKADLYNSYADYVAKEGKDDLKAICDKYKQIPDFNEDKNYYYDWGAEKLFSLAERGSGECSAGMFDLIEMDLNNIKATRKKLLEPDLDIDNKKQLLRDLVFFASRTLLITRGIEPKTEQDVFGAFNEHFIKTGLADGPFTAILDAAKAKDFDSLIKAEAQADSLAKRVEFLYEKMDNSFNFAAGPSGADVNKSQSQQPAVGLIRPALVKDFRGVPCPLNFVKTKVELARLKPGEILEIWLDDGEPIANVPGSVQSEGHKILSQKKADNYWAVVIEKI